MYIHILPGVCSLGLILGWDAVVGSYTRIEGTPNDPNPNKPFSKIEVKGMFNNEGKLNPSITVIGKLTDCPIIDIPWCPKISLCGRVRLNKVLPSMLPRLWFCYLDDRFLATNCEGKF